VVSLPRALIAAVFFAVALAAIYTVVRPRSRVSPVMWIRRIRVRRGDAYAKWEPHDPVLGRRRRHLLHRARGDGSDLPHAAANTL